MTERTPIQLAGGTNEGCNHVHLVVPLSMLTTVPGANIAFLSLSNEEWNALCVLVEQNRCKKLAAIAALN